MPLLGHGCLRPLHALSPELPVRVKPVSITNHQYDAILLGIVLAFFVTKDLASPLLMIAATLTGLLTVSLVELLNRTKLVKEDAAIGIVFPVLFSYH